MDRDLITIIAIVVIVAVLAVIAALVAWKRMSKIDHKAPEHRAKENELYEAFGEEHHELEPKGHNKKEHEVEIAFSGSENK